MRQHKHYRSDKRVRIGGAGHWPIGYEQMTAGKGDLVTFRYADDEPEHWGRVISAIDAPAQGEGFPALTAWLEVAVISAPSAHVFIRWIDPKLVSSSVLANEHTLRTLTFLFGPEFADTPPGELETWIESGYVSPRAMEDRALFSHDGYRTWAEELGEVSR